jgi:hypothetical protein
MSKFFRTLKRSILSLKATEYSKKTGKRDWTYVRYELWCSFLDTFYYSWKTPIDIFFEFLERVWKWLPVLWRDRNWDHAFILEVLEHKIKLTRECIGKYDRHTTAKRDCQNMRIAEILIRRIREDNYGDSFMEEHDAKWGKLEFRRDAPKDNVLFDNKFSKSGLVRANISSQEAWEKEGKEHKRIIDHCLYQKNQDYDYLFKHLKKHLEKWWD